MTAKGTYIGPEKQFKGRVALIRVISEGFVQAQFDEGKCWETNSWLSFDRRDWDIDDKA